MDESSKNLGDLRISGAGDANGGKFNIVRVSGAGDINGDVECEEFHSSGSSDLKGSLKARIVRISGASDIKGNVTAEEIRISGSSDIKGDVTTKKIRISGSSDIRGNLRGGYVEISGASDINGDCDAETFNARGGFDIGGLLNSDVVDIEIYGRCRVREIGGEKVKVVIGGDAGFLNKIVKYIFNKKEMLETSIIEADDIYLERTKCKIVRGKNVVIGPECEIGTVEYKDTIKVSTDSSVEKQVKIQ